MRAHDLQKQNLDTLAQTDKAIDLPSIQTSVASTDHGLALVRQVDATSKVDRLGEVWHLNADLERKKN